MKKLTVIILAVLIFGGAIGCFASELAETAAYTESEAAGENVFSVIYAFAAENSDKLLSALSLAVSVVLTFMYKKGLVPALSDSLVRIKNGVDTIGESAKKMGEESSASIGKTGEALELLTRLSESASERLGALEDFVRELEAEKDSNEKMKEILLSQIELLYSVFMSSSMPQYAKDRVGEQVAQMKKNISEEQTANG